MTTRYRIIHFVPDWVSGTRFPVGAALRRPDGRVSVVRAERLPDLHDAGRASALALLRRIMAELDRLKNLHSLPFGNHFAYDDVIHKVPKGVTDPEAWVVEHALPTERDEGRASA